MADGGFVLLDALAATAVLAVAGGAALATMTTLLANTDALLDRSMETTNIDSFVQTLILDWDDAEKRTWSDGTFRYQASLTSSTLATDGLARVRVQSFDAGDRIISDFELWVPQ